MLPDLSQSLVEYASSLVDEENREVSTVMETVSKVTAEMTRVTSEVQDLGIHFRLRLQQAVEETQSLVEERCRTEREIAVDQTRQVVRHQVTEELKDQFELELIRLRRDNEMEQRSAWLRFKELHEDFAKLESAIRDVSHKMSARLEESRPADEFQKPVGQAS